MKLRQAICQTRLSAFRIAVAGLLVASFFLGDAVLAEDYDRCNPPEEERKRIFQGLYGLRPGETKPLPGCPGADDFEPGIANFEMNEITFNVPRDYLPYSNREADGPKAALVLMMRYPELVPARSSVHVTKRVQIVIRRMNFRDSDNMEDCLADKHKHYDLMILQPIFFWHMGKKRAKFDVGYRADLGLSSVIRNRNSLFFEGQIERPSYWILCRSDVVSTCKSYIWLQNCLRVTFRFEKETFLSQHREIREAVIGKLSEFARQPLSER